MGILANLLSRSGQFPSSRIVKAKRLSQLLVPNVRVEEYLKTILENCGVKSNRKIVSSSNDTDASYRENLGHFGPLFVFCRQRGILRNKEVHIAARCQLLPCRLRHLTIAQDGIFGITAAPQIAVPDPFWDTISFHRKNNRDSLHDVEHIFVLAAAGGLLLLEGIAVQIEDVQLVKGCHQRLTHTAEGRVVQVAVIGYEPEDALARLVDLPLSEADELDIVVLKPLGVLLAQGLAVYRLVVAALVCVDEIRDPRSFVGACARIWGVSHYDEHWLSLLDGTS